MSGSKVLLSLLVFCHAAAADPCYNDAYGLVHPGFEWMNGDGHECTCREGGHNSECHTADVWVTCVGLRPNGCPADKPIDLFFILGSSIAVEPCQFYKQHEFLEEVISHFDMKNTRVSVSTFGTKVCNVIPLDNYHIDELFSLISNITYVSELHTNTGAAIKDMRTEARTGNNAKIAVVITGDKSSDANLTRQESKKAHDSGITMYAVGIGEYTDRRELRTIASSKETVTYADDYTALDSIKTDFAKKVCKDIVHGWPNGGPRVTPILYYSVIVVYIQCICMVT